MDRARTSARGARALEITAPGVNGARIDKIGFRKRFQFCGDPRRLSEQLRAALLRRFIGHAQQQRIARPLKLLFLVGGKGRRSHAVGEMGSAPARGGLDRVERRHGPAERDIFSRAVGHTQFGESEHIVVFARREFGHRHANVATDDAVAGAPAGGERGEAGIGEIGHEGLIVTLPEELYAGLKRGVVAGLDFEAHGKAEAGADAVEVVVCGQQRRAVDLDGFAEIDLHPFHRVGGGRQCAVVAAAGAGLSRIGGIALRRPFEAAGDFGVGFAGLRAQRSLEGGECGGRITLFATEILEAGVACVVAVVFPIGAVEGGENGLEAVVILLRDGIEFMIMALGAVDGETGKRADRVRDHVVAVEVSGDFPVGFGLRHFGVADEIPRTGGDET